MKEKMIDEAPNFVCAIAELQIRLSSAGSSIELLQRDGKREIERKKGRVRRRRRMERKKKREMGMDKRQSANGD